MNEQAVKIIPKSRVAKEKVAMEISKGTQIGDWTVVGEAFFDEKREKRWPCRCVCGEERNVLHRSLRHGGSMGCGCAKTAKATEKNAKKLDGMVFGQLTVLHKAEDQKEYGGVWWTCRCKCGELYDVPATLLVTGRRTKCTSGKHETTFYHADIKGRRFGQLEALYPTKKRAKKAGYVIWHCRCDCGNELDISYNNLMYGNQKSCGCKKVQHEKDLHNYLVHVADTSIDMIRSRKIPTNNKTGCRGVYLSRGKYVAKLTFQKKAYYLGSFKTLDEAIQARKEAEESVYKATVEAYNEWEEKARTDTIWAKEHPFYVIVKREANGHLLVEKSA